MRKQLSLLAMLSAFVAAPALGASFTVGSASATAQGEDPAFKTFTSSTGSEVPKTFDLNVVGDSIQFLTQRYFTDETSANQPDDPVEFPTVLTINFTGPAGVTVNLNGTTKGGQFGTEVIPGLRVEAGLADFGPEQEVTVGGFKLGVQALDTVYNDFLSGSQTGESFGANVPVKITLREIIDGGPDPTPIPLPAALPIGAAMLAGLFTAKHLKRKAD